MQFLYLRKCMMYTYMMYTISVAPPTEMVEGGGGIAPPTELIAQ